MKILYITHEYGERWVKYAQFLKDLGHEVDLIELLDKRTPAQVDASAYNETYDIVWVFAADYIWYKVLTDEFVQKVQESKSIFIGYCTLNTVIPFKDWVNNYKVFDWCFLHSQLVTDMAKECGLTNVSYQPYGFDIDEYFPVQTKKKFNISFVGSPQTNFPVEEDKRVQTIEALRSFKIHVFGTKFKKRLKRGIKIHDFNGHKDMNKAFNQSRINLNISLINSKLPEFIKESHPKNRFYEIPGSGNFMISGFMPELQEQFQDKIHCAYYNDIDDLCEKVEYYLSHEEERQEIAQEAYHHAVKYHQTKFRFKEMMNMIEEKYF